MGRVVTFAAPREVVVEDELDPPLAAGEVRVETLYSGISAGTELTAYRGTNPYLHREWDAERRLFVEGSPTFDYPLRGWGYEEVGRVVEAGSDTSLALDTVVWGAWGHRSSAAVGAEQAASRVVPDGLAPLEAVFARIGAIALNAVLDADVHLGEVVAVFGQGVPGLIVTQLAALSGATVVAVDPIRRRLELASSLGATAVVAGEEAAETVAELTGGRGADVSIELSGSYEALAEAIRVTAFGARVVAAGFYQGAGAALRLGEEFHHNRVELVSSQIGAVSPRLAHRWDRLRLEQTTMRLAAEGRLRLEPLVTHVLPVERAAEAFRLLDERPAEAVQVVLQFRPRTPSRGTAPSEPPPPRG
jgi:2-desacetyl-2-hydroxyethyl bacteriochlorophyllide A dehydrogenase